MASILEEKDAIHETIANYCYHFDGGEFNQWVDLFTEDGVFDGGEVAGVHTGKEALRAFVDTVPGRMAMKDGAPMLKHCVMNEIIKVDGEQATAKSYIVVVRSKGESALVNGIAGRYEDRLVKQGDRWLFTHRTVHFDLMGDMQ